MPVEDVVAGSILRQVRVLDGADADGAGHPVHFFGTEGRILRPHEFPRPLRRLVEKVEQTGAATLAGLERTSIGAEHHAEGVVFEGHPAVVSRRPGEREQLAKMQTLARVDDVEHPLGLKSPGSIAHRRQVRRVIEVAAVGFADDDRHDVAVLALELVEEGAQRALILG